MSVWSLAYAAVTAPLITLTILAIAILYSMSLPYVRDGKTIPAFRRYIEAWKRTLKDRGTKFLMVFAMLMIGSLQYELKEREIDNARIAKFCSGPERVLLTDSRDHECANKTKYEQGQEMINAGKKLVKESKVKPDV